MSGKRRTVPLAKRPELKERYQINRLLQTLEYNRERDMETEADFQKIRAYQAYCAELLKRAKK